MAAAAMSSREARRDLEARGATRFTKVLVLGKRGRGKGFVCNLLAGRKVFDPSVQAGVCTSELTAVPCMDERTDTGYLLYKFPAVVETDEASMQQNSELIKQAFREFPDDFTLVLFVVCPGDDRKLLDEDVEAYLAIRGHRFSLGVTPTMVIVNKYEKPSVECSGARVVLADSVRMKLRPHSVAFVPILNDTDGVEAMWREKRLPLLKCIKQLVPQTASEKVELENAELKEKLASAEAEITSLKREVERANEVEITSLKREVQSARDDADRFFRTYCRLRNEEEERNVHHSMRRGYGWSHPQVRTRTIADDVSRDDAVLWEKAKRNPESSREPHGCALS